MTEKEYLNALEETDDKEKVLDLVGEAVWNGCERAVEACLTKYKKLGGDIRTEDGSLLLNTSNPRILELLVKAGIDVDADVDGDDFTRTTTPLLDAIEKGDIAKVETLFSLGADSNKRILENHQLYCCTPLHYVAEEIYEDTAIGSAMIKILLENNADPDATLKETAPFTPLHLVTARSVFPAEKTQAFLDAGVDPNVLIAGGDFKGFTPMDFLPQRFLNLTCLEEEEEKEENIECIKKYKSDVIKCAGSLLNAGADFGIFYSACMKEEIVESALNLLSENPEENPERRINMMNRLAERYGDLYSISINIKDLADKKIREIQEFIVARELDKGPPPDYEIYV